MFGLYGLFMTTIPGLVVRSGYYEIFGKEPSRIIEDINLMHSGTDFLIRSSSFNNMVGGAIYFYTSTPLSVMFEEILFYNCTSFDSGALYFKCANSEIALHRICASDCFVESSNDCQFCYISVHSGKKLLFNFSTVTHCAPSNRMDRTYGSYLHSGLQNITYSNASFNYASQCATFCFDTASNEVRYCTIAKNSASSQYVIEKKHSSVANQFIMCNFIDNTASTSVISVVGGSTLSNCIFMGNTYHLFNLDTGYHVFIQNGWIKHPHSIATNNYNYMVQMTSVTNSYDETKTWNIKHLSTQQCYVVLDNTYEPLPSPTECFFQSQEQGEQLLSFTKLFGSLFTTLSLNTALFTSC